MKAVVLKEPRHLVLMDVPRPVLTDECHVLIDVKACGICGSDLRYWAGENPWALHTLGEHVDNPPDMVLGHELSGVVVEVNAAGYEPLLGKRVGVQAFRTCGICALCRSGRENLCRHTTHIGHAQGWGKMAYYPGGYAEYCLAWADLLHPMANHVSFEQEAMRDILGVAVHAVGRGGVHRGDVVLCIGGGPVGLCIAQVARERGARTVLVSEPSAVARRVLDQVQGLVAINPADQTIERALQQHTGSTQVSAVFDTVGSTDTILQALPLLSESAIHVNLAVHDVPLQASTLALGSERTLTTSSNAFYGDEREAHELIESGAVNTGCMVTHRFPLAAFQQAFDLLLREPREAYKVVLS